MALYKAELKKFVKGRSTNIRESFGTQDDQSLSNLLQALKRFNFLTADDNKMDKDVMRDLIHDLEPGSKERLDTLVGILLANGQTKLANLLEEFQGPEVPGQQQEQLLPEAEESTAKSAPSGDGNVSLDSIQVDGMGNMVGVGNVKIDKSKNQKWNHNSNNKTTSTVTKTISKTENVVLEYLVQNAPKNMKIAFPVKDQDNLDWRSPDNIDSSVDFDGLPTEAPKFIPGKGRALLLVWDFITTKEEVLISRGVNVDNYKKQRRKGAEHDIKMAKKKFQELTGNEVMVGHNLFDADAVAEKLQEFKDVVLGVKERQQGQKYEKPAYTVVIISTHGRDGDSLLMDSLNSIKLFHHIIYQLSHTCPGFEEFGREKPRLYFVQACQSGIPVAFSPPSNINVARNFFVGFSTIPGHKSKRSHSSGSYYIDEICTTLEKNGDFLGMLKAVDQKIENRIRDNNNNPKRRKREDQVPSMLSTLDFPHYNFKF